MLRWHDEKPEQCQAEDNSQKRAANAQHVRMGKNSAVRQGGNSANGKRSN